MSSSIKTYRYEPSEEDDSDLEIGKDNQNNDYKDDKAKVTTAINDEDLNCSLLD